MIHISRGRGGTGAWRVSFSLPKDSPPGVVSVVGDFNDWRPGRHVLQNRSNGRRSVAVEVIPGTTLQFRYLGEDGLWFNDPDHAQQSGDNCVVTTAG